MASASGADAASNVTVSGPCGVMHVCSDAPPEEGTEEGGGGRCGVEGAGVLAGTGGSLYEAAALPSLRTGQEAVGLGVVHAADQAHEL